METKTNPSESDEIDKLRLATRNKELEIEEKRLDHKYKLSKQGLTNGSVAVGLFFVTILILIGIAYFKAPADQPVLSGWHIVAIILIGVAGLVAYFSLVFWREVRLSAEFSEKGLKIDGGTGKGVNDA